ncbi:MAG: hypothetical protein BWY08_01391 [Bacteroidetes bacterium ADurb.Bin174]|nr:MAG: hypothetical protein BWY08_01391 [Bacteroidetes bacterium ADurb.Bin174]
MYIYDDIRVGYLVVFVLPIIFYYLFKFRGKALVLYLILSLAFTAGSIELLSGFDTNDSLKICELLIWALTIYVLLITPRREIPYLRYIVGFVLICLISYIINPVNFVQLLLFLRKYLLFVAVFVLFHNIKLPDIDRENLLKFIILLFSSQIVVNLARYPITNQTEYYIGTISLLNGSITAIFALVGITFSFSAYLYKRKLVYIILIFGFFIFSVVGIKRGHLFLLPLLLLIQYIVYLRYTQENFLRNALIITPVILIVTGLLMYFSFTLVPSLNPENIMGGSFDPAYVINFIDHYLNPGRPIEGIQYFGRGEAPLAVYELLKNNGLLSLLLGLGPGDIVMSKYTIPGDVIMTETMLTGIKYNIGYGARTGVLFSAMQIGFLGAIVYFLFVFKVFSQFFNKSFYANEIPVDNKIIALGLAGFLGVFIFDFFAYSQVTFQNVPIILPVCFAYYYVMSKSIITCIH